jgi:hypothetical protein
VKKLYLVPIIHTSADMASLASALDEGATVGLGQELWQRHKQIVSRFWDSIVQFFDSLDVHGFKVYQDGLVADGTDGLRIVKEGISRGSKNYEIIGKLLERRAVLVKTEDPPLVKQEHTYITKVAQSKSLREREAAVLRYKLAQGKLLKRRDDFIAKRIGETLGQGETGILFIGAYHDVLSRLPDDVHVNQIKDVAKVREYHKALANRRRHGWHFHQLAEYLISPVSNASPQ